MHTYLGATANFKPEFVDENLIKNSEWLYIEGYEFSEELSTNAIFKSIKIAKENNTKIALTVSADFIISVFRDNLLKAAKEADLVFCNESEAMNFTSTDNYESAFKALSEICPNVVVTLGKKGAIYKWNDKVFNIPAYSNEVVDTTGAGDMFAGTFLFGIINDNSPVKAGHLASYASGRIVSQFGARINDDMIEIKNKVYNDIIPSL
jgi:sugar/nucleoside kinase (ribokinase family)